MKRSITAVNGASRRWISNTPVLGTTSQGKGGAGLGNVESKMLPSTLSGPSLFRHSKHPHTASIIG